MKKNRLSKGGALFFVLFLVLFCNISPAEASSINRLPVILNKSITQLSDRSLNSIVSANTESQVYQMPLSQMLRYNMHTIIILLALVFAVLVLIIVTTSRKNRERLERVAYVDELTGLPTHIKFQLNTMQVIKAEGPSGFLMVSLDVDNFKYVNDVFGYEMGNRILKCMSDHFLQYPQAYRLIGRSNADNFMFLVEAPYKERAIERFLDMLNIGEELQTLLPFSYSLVFSAGVYEISDPNEAFESWCDKANIARKAVKGGHLNALQEYTAEMDRQMSWKKEITLSMEGALTSEDFKVYLQPKVRFSDGAIAGAEALVRWQHPKAGMLQPISFIPLFERNGFIVKLDLYMFRQVCELIRGWLDKGIEAPQVSVNLSRRHLANKYLVEDLLEITREYDLAPERLELELTESIVLDDSQGLIEIMHRLKSEGFCISVDDFGSGYSSLNLLADLPVDVLKLDKGFLHRVSDVGSSHLIVEQVIGLAKKLKLSTVAEGVETKEQADALREMGCDLAQGFYYAQPMPSDEFETRLALVK